VTIALPQISRHLHVTEKSLQWVASAYLLTYGGFLLLGGRAADLLERRRLLVGGTAVFGVSSCANAPLLEFVRTGGEVSVVDLPGAAPRGGPAGPLTVGVG
jgi:MFS family permease